MSKRRREVERLFGCTSVKGSTMAVHHSIQPDKTPPASKCRYCRNNIELGNAHTNCRDAHMEGYMDGKKKGKSEGRKEVLKELCILFEAIHEVITPSEIVRTIKRTYEDELKGGSDD